jgi:hypothetical protein
MKATSIQSLDASKKTTKTKMRLNFTQRFLTLRWLLIKTAASHLYQTLLIPLLRFQSTLDWLDQLVTLAVPPKHLSWETAQELVRDFENTILFADEAEMIKTFLDLIDDADVLSGWNSEGYDIPYTVNRCVRVLSKDDTRKFCLWGQLPKKRVFERFGAENETYDLIGRVHMDYMQLYRKYTYEERHSYSLDAICEYELGERKTQFEGTLDQFVQPTLQDIY